MSITLGTNWRRGRRSTIERAEERGNKWSLVSLQPYLQHIYNYLRLLGGAFVSGTGDSVQGNSSVLVFYVSAVFSFKHTYYRCVPFLQHSSNKTRCALCFLFLKYILVSVHPKYIICTYNVPHILTYTVHTQCTYTFTYYCALYLL